MAFRASNVIPADEYKRAKHLAVQLKTMAAERSAAFASGGTAAHVLSVAGNLRGIKKQLQAFAAVPGIGAYAVEQEADPDYSVGTEFNGMISAIDSAVAFIVQNMPKDADGFLLVNRINADGSLTPRDFTGQQLSGLSAALDGIVAAID